MSRVKKIRVFLSHNGKDKPLAERLAEKLLDEPDIAPRLDKWHLIPGRSVLEALEEELNNADVCLACIGSGEMGPWQDESF